MMAKARLFVNSLPKSGTNLVAKLVEMMGYSYTDASIASSSVIGRRAVAKMVIRSTTDAAKMVRVGQDTAACASRKWVESVLDGIGDGQYATGHAPYSDQLMSLLQARHVRIIQVIRDPRDVVLSRAHFLATQQWHYAYEKYADASMQDRIDFTLDGGRTKATYVEGFASVMRNIEGWLSHPHVLTVRFEDLIGDKGGSTLDAQMACLARIAAHLGEEGVDLHQLQQNLHGGTHTFRKGRMNAWAEELSPTQVDQIENALGHMLDRFGYQPAAHLTGKI